MARKGADYDTRNRGDALWEHYCRLLERAETSADFRLSRAPV
jgi:hypothetical protein